jgi:cytochrome P450
MEPVVRRRVQQPDSGLRSSALRCPVAHSEQLHCSLFRHEDVMRVLHSPNVFSNPVSGHLAVPNGFDIPEHTAYRRIIDSYFSAQRLAEFEPVCQEIAGKLIARLPRNRDLELTPEFADLFASEMQCAFLEWPVECNGLARIMPLRCPETKPRYRQSLWSLTVAFETCWPKGPEGPQE